MRTKKLKLKVDNLNHISDHGLAVEFSDPQLKALINGLKKDGTTTLEAGLSKITLQTVGRVTFTKLFLAHGSYTIKNVHYLDEPANLRFTFKRQGDQEEVAYDTLKAVILGGELPSQFKQSTSFGSTQDVHRTWLKKYGWTLAGENGLRAKAIEGIKSSIDGEIKSLDYSIGKKARDIGQFDARNFDAEIVNARKRAKSIIEHNNKEETRIRDAYAKAEAEDFSDESQKSDTGGSYYNAPEHLRLLGMQRMNPYGQNQRLVMPAVNATMSHPVHRPNYTATRNEDNVILSSGIHCEVTASHVLGWLRGEIPEVKTRYGAAQRIEAATPDGQPIIIVKCGCHYLDMRNMGEDFSEVLKPTHTVTVTGGKVEIKWDAENKSACLERMKESLDWSLKSFDDNKRAAANEFFTMRKSLMGLRDNKSLHMDTMQREEKALEDAKVGKELELKNHPLLSMSGSLEQLNNAMIAASNALCGIRA